jgi:hypothetical protein
MFSMGLKRTLRLLCLGFSLSVAGTLAPSGGSQAASPPPLTTSQGCIDCHTKVSPSIVTDWKSSEHFKNNVSCDSCHGSDHTTMDDSGKARAADAKTCAQCHEKRVNQFMAGKHAKAWIAMYMPNFNTHGAHPFRGDLLVNGSKGCGGCHKFAPKSPEDTQKNINAGTGLQQQAGCDACHTRHTFSAKEARQPQACKTCHQGNDHNTWVYYEGSKHGVRAQLKQVGALPKDAAAPTCASCHMPDGNHEVRTAGGFWGLRWPLSESAAIDPAWSAAQATIMRSLGVIDEKHNPTPAMEGIKALDLMRFNGADWKRERDKMIDTCSSCHTRKFSVDELAKGDALLREADKIMASAINVVADLYRDGVIKNKPANLSGYVKDFPQVLGFHSDKLSPPEQKLFRMFLDVRPNMYMAAYHNNPEFPIYMGYGEMTASLNEIKLLASEMREKASVKKKKKR